MGKQTITRSRELRSKQRTKTENIENTKSEGEAKGEDEQYGKPNQQYKNHQKAIAAESKTRNKGENREIKHRKDKINKITNKTIKLEAINLKLHQETLEDNEIEHKLKKERPNREPATTKRKRYKKLKNRSKNPGEQIKRNKNIE